MILICHRPLFSVTLRVMVLGAVPDRTVAMPVVCGRIGGHEINILL